MGGMKSHLTKLGVGFIIGVLIHSLFLEVQPTLLVGILIFIALIILIYLRKYVIFIVVLAGIGLGVARFHSTIGVLKEGPLDTYLQTSEISVLKGIVVSEPEYQRDTLRFVVELVDEETKVRVSTSPFFQVNYADSVTLRGKLTLPKDFKTETNRTFSYQKYLAKDGIRYLMRYAEVSHQIPPYQLSIVQKITRFLYSIKGTLVTRIHRKLPQPHSGLLAGVLFGKQDALDEHTTESFRRVGLMHIVVLSGYNVALVISVIMRIFTFLPLKVRSLVSVLGIVLFTLLVGAGPTVIRAAIMSVFLILAPVLGGKYNVNRALILTGVCMVIINPWLLVFDLSFQLSFLATYGLLSFTQTFERWLSFIPSFLELRQSAATTLAAQVAVTPLLLYKIGEFSIIAPLVNTIVLFAVPWAMLFGFVTSLRILPPVFDIISYAPLSYILKVVGIASAFPFAVLNVSPFHVVIVIIIYLVIFLWEWNIRRL